MSRTVPAWRIVTWHPLKPYWSQGVTYYRDRQEAAQVCRWLHQQKFRAFLVPTTDELTGHGVQTG